MSGPNSGDKPPRWDKGTGVFAQDLNRIVAALAKRILGDGFITVSPSNGNLIISLTELRRQRIPAVTFPARLVAEGSGGDYTWAPFAVGPGQAEVNIDDTCHEYNDSTGIQTGAPGTGTVVRLFKDIKIGETTPRWYFFFPVGVCSGGGA